MNYNRFDFFILVLLFSVASSRAASPNKFEEGLLKVIEKWRAGEKSLPIALPRLPLSISPLSFYDDGYYLNLFEGLNIKGLENMHVNRLSGSEQTLKVSLDISIPDVVVSDMYHLTGSSWYIFSVDDGGVLYVHINNVKAIVDVQFGKQGANTVVTSLAVNYYVDRVATNLNGSSIAVNYIMDRKIRNVIKGKSSATMSELRNKLTNVMDEFLRGHTPAELIKMIKAI